MVTPRFFATCVTFFARFSLDKAVKLSATLRFLDAAISSVSPISDVARPGPTRACALPSTSQALPLPTQLESRDSTTNQIKVKKIHNIAVLTAIVM